MKVVGFGDLGRNLRELQRDLTPRPQDLAKVAELLVPEVKAAVAADIGDDSMSGWRRGAPIPIAGAANVRKGSVIITRNKESAGMMRVLDEGRNRGTAPGLFGPGISANGLTRRTKSGNVRKVANRSGLVVGDGRTRSKWNGVTRARHTWSDAMVRMKRTAPRHVEEVVGAEMADRIVKVVTRGR